MRNRILIKSFAGFSCFCEFLFPKYDPPLEHSLQESCEFFSKISSIN